MLYGPHARDAAERGLRLIGYDRPGYGKSSPRPGRTVADTAADVRAICAELNIERMAMWGMSGGGPHVLACAALLPDLVSAAASLASPAPPDAEGLDWFAGMGQCDADDVRLFRTDEVAARAKMDKDREELLAVSPGDVADAADPRGGPDIYGFYLSCLQAGLAPGSAGWWDDNCFLRPWGFDPADIVVPVLLLQGGLDTSVPPAHGEWLAARIPGAEARLLGAEGHVTIPNRVPEVHAWLSGRR